MKPSRRRPWVIIIEDDKSLGDALCERLASEDFRVLSSQRIADALIKLGNQRFDCILLDLKLSEANGETVIGQIRSDKNCFNHDTPILIMSGFIDKNLVNKIKDEVDGFIVKPFSKEDLVAKISSLVRKRWADFRYVGAECGNKSSSR